MKVKVTDPTVVRIDGLWVPFMGEVDVDDKTGARLLAAGAQPVGGGSPVEEKVPAPAKKRAPAPEKKEPTSTEEG